MKKKNNNDDAYGYSQKNSAGWRFISLQESLVISPHPDVPTVPHHTTISRTGKL
jgi:hypothetical protein